MVNKYATLSDMLAMTTIAHWKSFNPGTKHAGPKNTGPVNDGPNRDGN